MASGQTSGQRGDGTYNDDAPEVSAQIHAPQASTDALDALLDEIDGSLQVNAEQFVRSFVQKGGE